MILPSETYHQLRHPNCTKKEVGTLKVEVLQCLGLPKLDRTSMTDAIVYLVCGEYAFATDVIPNRANPMWLRKSRRACTFPIFHAYARLYVGVFDDDRKRVKDEFAGRVVIDLARLRPRSTYDVTLPLRLSTHVYSRRRRGAIRLRFSLTWHAERDALLSYIPSRIRVPLPQNSRPNLDVVVLCSDQKAFRNIAITVHGTNLPGKFTFQQMRGMYR
jgi:Ca2+-dependent lipid-binding protein